MVAVDPGGWYPFGPSKWLVISVLVPAGVAAMLLSRPARTARWASLAAAALLGWLALAAALGVDGVYAWIGTPERHLGVLTWGLCAVALVGGQSLDLDRDRTALVWALAIGGLAVGALATAEGLGWEPEIFDVSPSRLSATMGSAAYLGAATALLLPAAIGIASDRELARAPRSCAVAAAPLLTVACLGAGARAAWVGLSVAAVIVLAVHRPALAGRPRATLAGAAGLVVLIAALIALTPVGDRVGSAADPDQPGGRSRVDEWRVAARVIADHPITGVGPEGYRIAFADGVDDDYERAHGRDPLPDRAHAAPLDVALAGGLPALIAWAALMALFVRSSVRAIRSGPPWLAGVGAALLAHVGGQLLLFPTAELEPVAWLLGGVLVAATTPTTARVIARPIPVVLALIAVVALAAGATDVIADRRAGHAADALAAGDADGAVTAARAATDLRADEVRLHLLLAQALLADEQGTGRALDAIDDALAISPLDPIARRHRARVLVQRAAATGLPADVAAARAEVDVLVADDPSNASLWLLAGTAARLDADARAAERAFTKAENLAPRDPVASIELALLYLDLDRRDDARAAAGRAVARAPDDPRARDVLARIDADG